MADSHGASAWFSDSVAYPGVDIRRDMSALLMNSTSRTFGGRSGRRPGTGGIPTVSGTTITVPAGVCQVDAAAPSASASFLVSWSSAQTLSLAPADASNPRVDIVYVRVDEVPGSPTTQTITFGYQAGNAASDPQPPTTLSDSTAVAKVCILGYIRVPKAGGGAATVSGGPVMVANGGILPIASQAERDALTPYEGLYVHRADLGDLERYVGGRWKWAVGAKWEKRRHDGLIPGPEARFTQPLGIGSLVGGAWSDAPTGGYLVGANIQAAGENAAAAANFDLIVDGVSLTRGSHLDVDGQSRPYAYVYPVDHVQGDLQVNAQINVLVGPWTVYENVTSVWAVYLG